VAVVRSEKLVIEGGDSLETQRKDRTFAVEAANKQRLLMMGKTENSPVILMITLANTYCDDYIDRMMISQVSLVCL
jgi:hypothetical protein